MDKIFLDKKQVAKNVINGSIARIKVQKKDIDKFYNGFEKIIYNQMENAPEWKDKGNDLINLLERLRTLFKDDEIIKIINEHNITGDQILSIYGDSLLGDDKREYNMSGKFNKDLNETSISSYTEAQDNKTQRYVNIDGNEIDIQRIGRLTYKEWNGAVSSINKYKVLQKSSDGEEFEREVFTDINLSLMEDPEYIEAVFAELLSYNNIELSNVGGYIGKVVKVPKTTDEFEVQSEKEIAGNYCYRINDKYMLTYDSAELDAVMRHNIKEMKDCKVNQLKKNIGHGDYDVAR